MSDILETLKALAAKAKDKGSSRSEVESALNMIRKLTQKHNLGDADVFTFEPAQVSNVIFTAREVTHEVDMLVNHLAHYCGVLVKFDKTTDPTTVVVTGSELCIGAFRAMRTLIKNAMDHEYTLARLQHAVDRKSFMQGMAVEYTNLLVEKGVMQTVVSNGLPSGVRVKHTTVKQKAESPTSLFAYMQGQMATKGKRL